MTPTNVAYGTVQGKLAAGRFPPDPVGYSTLLNTIAGWSGNTWYKVNLNAAQDVAVPVNYRNPGGGAFGIFNAWPSGGCDTKRHRFHIFGGGHANTTANEVYTFDFITGLWRCSFLPSVNVANADGTFKGMSVDINASPASAHCYYNNNYLRVLDRFWVRGGARQSGAQQLGVWSDAGVELRAAGGYTLDLDRAGLSFVGGKTGANIDPSVHGVQAWYLRDWYTDAGHAALLSGRTARSSGSAYALENGRDVLYLTSNGNNSGTHIVVRVEFVNQDWRNDIITLVSSETGDNPGGNPGSLVLDSAKQVLLSLSHDDRANNVFQFVDLKRTHGASNQWYRVATSGIAGGAAVTNLLAAMAAYDPNGGGNNYGLAFDPNVGAILFVAGDGLVFKITPPAGNPTPTTGWAVSQVTVGGNAGMGQQAGPLMGKCRYAADLGCTVAIRDSALADVWLFKPAEWVRPTGY